MVRTRTRLTTLPGQEPALSTDARPEGEHYVAGLGLPTEPPVPGRFRRTWATLAIVVVVVALGAVAFLLRTANQDFDPALEPRFTPGEGDATEDGLPGEP